MENSQNSREHRQIPHFVGPTTRNQTLFSFQGYKTDKRKSKANKILTWEAGASECLMAKFFYQWFKVRLCNLVKKKKKNRIILWIKQIFVFLSWWRSWWGVRHLAGQWKCYLGYVFFILSLFQAGHQVSDRALLEQGWMEPFMNQHSWVWRILSQQQRGVNYLSCFHHRRLELESINTCADSTLSHWTQDPDVWCFGAFCLSSANKDIGLGLVACVANVSIVINNN